MVSKISLEMVSFGRFRPSNGQVGDGRLQPSPGREVSAGLPSSTSTIWKDSGKIWKKTWNPHPVLPAVVPNI